MDIAAVVAILVIAAAIAVTVLLVFRARGVRRRAVRADGEGDQESVRERARALQESEAARGFAAGSAYGSGLGGDAP